MKKFSIILLTVLIGLLVFADIDFNDPEGFDRELPNAEYLLEKSPPEFKWGDDTQVYAGNVGGCAFDVDYRTGVLYAVVLTRNVALVDSVLLYNSYNNGNTWNYMRLAIICGSGNELENPEIIVTDDGKVSCFILYVESDGTRNLYMREFDDSSATSSSHWETIDRGNSDTVYAYDVDYQDGYYYVAYNAIYPDYSTDLSLFGASLHEDSSTWINQTILYGDLQSTEDPKIAAGANGNAYVGFITDRASGVNDIRVKRTYDYGASWEGSLPVSSLTTQIISNIDVTASTNPSFQSVWFTVQFDNLDNFGYYYSADSCVTNQYGGIFMSPKPGTWIEQLGTISFNETNNFATIAFKADSGDSHDVGMTWTFANNPTGFVAVEIINDYPATGTFAPYASNLIGNSAIIYGGWGPTNLYFDSYIKTGIEDEMVKSSIPEVYTSAPIFRDNISIFFNLDNETFVNLHIIDATGRIVKDFNAYYQKGNNSIIWNGNDNRGDTVPNGTYFYRVSFGSEIYSGKITYLK